MIVRAAMVDGRQLEVYEGRSGHRRYWAMVNHRALFQRGSLRVRTFATADTAWAAALRESKTSPRISSPQSPTRVPGYSNFGGGGPLTPMGSPRRTPR